MSLRALRLAVRNQLKAAVLSGGLALTQKECEVMLDGRPPPRCGERFVSVHGGTCTLRAEGDPALDLDETYTLLVTVTMRLPRVPFDRIGPDLIDKASSGLDVFCQSVKVCVHKDADDNRIIRAANILLGADADGHSGIDGFVEPLRFLGHGDDQVKGPDWFHADPDADGGVVEAGLARVFRLGGARKIQSLESMV